jgi:hypothetical protein
MGEGFLEEAALPCLGSIAHAMHDGFIVLVGNCRWFHLSGAKGGSEQW